jgi:metal-responsive CopG/Arc/MetJ family transcriptional regulator
MRLSQREKEVSVKYTTVLPRCYIDELKAMVRKKTIPSVNQGIRSAVESFVADHQKRAYETQMKEAASDVEFIKRTLETQEIFSESDAENEVIW